MSITIELPAEVESQIMSLAAAESTTPAAILSRLVADLFRSEDGMAIFEIGQALSEMEAAETRGDYGIPVDDAFAELERRSAERRKQRGEVA